MTGFPSYRRVLEHAYATVRVLSQHNLVNKVLCGLSRCYATLKKKKKKEDCDHYGPYFSLLTSERVCGEDIALNPSHWVVPTGPHRSLAGDLFRLPKQEIEQLPRPQLPSSHIAAYVAKPVVNLRATIQLAISYHWSTEAMFAAIAAVDRCSMDRVRAQVEFLPRRISTSLNDTIR